MNDRKPPWWAGGRLVGKRDIAWDFNTGSFRFLLLRYDLRTGQLYAALEMTVDEELRMLEERDGRL